ncbi:MAG: tRNA guanosine(34) transglycosylase Tgt [Candidatus Pacebacteria bacterium]|nr:tRNA guanosine(34) transglycosylase Tgt [Candidatus Paceibacterota bacterium]
MLEFKIIKKSKKSNARVGIIKTEHGLVETPTLVPVATQGTVKALTNEEVIGTKTQILIANTYHLHLKPGEKIIKKAGGLHKFMKWQLPLMTDSGGFQVFSLGFGKDYGMGKILKEKSDAEVVTGQQPSFLKITPDGVWFRSIVDGAKLFMGPKESIKIQEDLGADIIFAFDECPPPIADYNYVRRSMEKTHRWAKECLKVKSSKKQALYGIVQGGKFKDLRIESAKFIGSLPFEGFGIGGEFGDDKKIMGKMLKWVNEELPENKPRHLLGIGHPEDLLPIIKAGVDTFDCTAPTHYARRGVAFTSKGRLDLRKGMFLKDMKPIDEKCDCAVCKSHSRSYIHHLFKAKEITPLRLLSFHNLYFFNTWIEKIREDIKNGKI